MPEDAQEGETLVGKDGSAGQEPVSDGDLHNPNKAGPSSAPPASSLSGDPLDKATKDALDPDKPTVAEGGPAPTR